MAWLLRIVQQAFVNIFSRYPCGHVQELVPVSTKWGYAVCHGDVNLEREVCGSHVAKTIM